MGTCHRCGRSGHVARDCSLHTCFRCNGKGHMAWECVEGVTCGRCGEKGHLQRNCKLVECHRCGRKGHISKFCNDPFAKAAEVEKNESHRQALRSGRGWASDASIVNNGRQNMAMKEPTMQRDKPGPWDGLGANANKMEKHQVLGKDSSLLHSGNSCNAGSSTALVSSRKRMVPASIQSVVSQRLRIRPCEKPEAVENPSAEAAMTKPHWQGLVEYGSEEDSNGDEDEDDVSLSPL